MSSAIILLGVSAISYTRWAIGVLNSLTDVGAASLGVSPTALGGWPLLVSVFCPAGFAATQLAGPFAAVHGRAPAVQGMAALGVASGCCSALAAAVGPGPRFAGFWLFFAGRALIGFASGASTVIQRVALSPLATDPRHAHTSSPAPLCIF
jgi:MFS family permease